MAKITINSSALLPALRSQTRPHLLSLQNQVAARARQLAKRRSGKLAGSVETGLTQTGRGPVYRVIAEAPHAMAAHEGAKPHVIRARSKGALHFFWENRGLETIVPRRGGFRTHVNRGGILMIGKGRVDHPGMTGNKFLVRALERAMGAGGY